MKEIHQPVKPGGIAKVPMVMQMEALECGAASLDMILGYYGRYVPLSQIRKECGVSRDGSNLKSMGLVAKSYGLQVRLFRYDLNDLKTEAAYPCILFWDRNHFVVLTGYRKGRFYLNDPARGAVRLSEDEFRGHYSEVCMLFQPTEAFEPGGRPDSVWRFAREYMRGTRSVAAFVLLTTFLMMLIGLMEPIIPRFFVDHLLGPRGTDQWSELFFAAYLLLTVAKFSVSWLNASYLLKMQGKMAVVSSTRFLWHVLRLPIEFFSQRLPADVMQRQVSNSTISSVLISRYVPLALDALSMLFYLMLMIQYSPLMALIGVLSVAANIWISMAVSRKRINLSRVQMKNAALLSSTGMAGISMIETIKSSGCEDGFFEYWAGLQAAGMDDRVKRDHVDHYLGQLPELISTLTGDLILCAGVGMIIRNNWTMGLVTAFIGFLNAFTGPVDKLVKALQSFVEMRTNMERINDVMQYPAALPEESEADDPGRVYQKLSGQFELKNVTFGYNRLRPPLISDFSLTVEPGQSVALVGSSGSGKSTLAKLLLGLYQPWKGDILFDGKPISAISHSEFTSSVVSVDQEITLFADTIRSNITMYDRSITDEAMIEAAKDAQIYDKIMVRDNGFDSEMEEGGRDFSGGERQRIVIAHALAEEPQILVLDEATSALDAETEYKIVEALRRRNVTNIMISHRLSIVRDCDLIVVLKNGVELDRGRHEELMERCAYYANMITNQ